MVTPEKKVKSFPKRSVHQQIHLLQLYTVLVSSVEICLVYLPSVADRFMLYWNQTPKVLFSPASVVEALIWFGFIVHPTHPTSSAPF